MVAKHLLDLPQELVNDVLALLPPRAVTRFGRTCQRARHLIRPANQVLWRTAFLKIFDDPENAWKLMPASYVAPRNGWDWHAELKARILTLDSLKNGLEFPDDDHESHNDQTAEGQIKTLLSIIDTAKFAPTEAEAAAGRTPRVDDRHSANLEYLEDLPEFYYALDKLIHDTGLPSTSTSTPLVGAWHMSGGVFTRSMAMAAEEQSRPQSACRLHVLQGLTVRERHDYKIRGVARRKVYNWNFTNANTEYGPFQPDGSGRVNWRLLEAVCSVIGGHVEMCFDGKFAMPQGCCFSIPHRTLIDPTVPRDWARATGTWLGTYAHLHYSDFFGFNTGVRTGRYPTLDRVPEFDGGLMELKLKLDMSARHDPELQTTLPMCRDLPPLYFTGHSCKQEDVERPEVHVKGLVCLLPGGREVRWKFVIGFNGEDMWVLEGVQPGGIRSGGVFGMWSQVEHGQYGAVGPFCYYPAELCKPTSLVRVVG